MEFTKIALQQEFTIASLISLHYFEFAKDYIFEGEKHDFWEFLYVDRGEIDVTADEMGYTLKQGDIIFHKPGEFHSVWANRKIAPNIIVVSFDCQSPALRYFENKIFSLGDFERDLITNILKEGFEAFLPPLDKPRVHTLARRETSLFGCEQLVRNYIELLLIQLVRKGFNADKQNRLSSSVRERSEDDLVKRLAAHMRQNISGNLTLDALCSFANMGKTQLVKLFRDRTGLGAMEYFKNLKIEEAKKLIREEKFNITEISVKLGYSTIHCFSRAFKGCTGMAPSEYAKTVKARALDLD